MNDQTAGTDTALTTVEEALSAAGRADVLSQFARMALGQTPNEAAAEGGDEPNARQETVAPEEPTAKQPNDLSQSNAEPTEATEAQAEEAEGEEKPEAEAGEGEDELAGKLDEHTQHAINKRIAKEVAKTKAAQEQREQLEAQVAELRQQLEAKAQAQPETVPPVPMGNNPLAHVTDLNALALEQAKAEQALEQAEELLESLQDEPERVEAALRQANVKLAGPDGLEDYSLPQMRHFLRNVRRTASTVVKQAVPQQAQYLAINQKAQAKAQELMPELKDTKSARYAKYQEVLKAFPQIKALPEWPVAVVVQVAGLEALEAKAKASKPVEAKAKPPLPTKIPAPKAAAPPLAAGKSGGLSPEVYKAAMEGDKNARLKVIQTYVPKFT